MEAITLHKQNYSIYDIQALLKAKGHIISHTAISEILREEGFARLPKRSKVEVRQVRNYHGAFSDYYSPKPGKFCTAGNIDRKGKMDPFDRW